jgi:hypothetical protein
MERGLIVIKRMLLACAVAGLLVGGGTGCLVTSKSPNSGHSSSAVKKKDCAPSQYWDGNKCRHKGKGKGARKHDR